MNGYNGEEKNVRLSQNNLESRLFRYPLRKGQNIRETFPTLSVMKGFGFGQMQKKCHLRKNK